MIHLPNIILLVFALTLGSPFLHAEADESADLDARLASPEKTWIYILECTHTWNPDGLLHASTGEILEGLKEMFREEGDKAQEYMKEEIAPYTVKSSTLSESGKLARVLFTGKKGREHRMLFKKIGNQWRLSEEYSDFDHGEYFK